MASIKWKTTNYPGIYEYETNRGKRYGVRVRYYKDGERIEKSKSGIRTIAEAKAVQTEFENLVNNNKEYIFENANLTLNAWNDIYMANFKLKKYSKDTIRHKENIYKNHLKEEFGDRLLTKITLNDYEHYLASKIEKGYSRGTVLTIHRSMKAIMNAAVKHEKLSKNRLLNVDIPEIQETMTVETKVLETDQFNAFVVACKEMMTKYDFAMVYLAIWGMRRGEVMGVRLRTVEFDHNKKVAHLSLDSSRTLRTPEGKGTKTAAGNRVLIIPGEGYQLLVYAIDKAKSIAKDHNTVLHQDDFIFRNPTSNKPWAVTRLNDLMTKVHAKYGIDVHPHMLRHSFATQATLAGVNQKDLQKFVGHGNEHMTNYYTHETKEGTEQLVDLMQKRFTEK
ncbi:tyrosine-type recombinase/integrase [Listeria booriae]|uniref:tyrosine-type recombinase/integrase n=1 Tax=Listeria booriae TaxID=1552123 RepID=UPI00162679B5|nr:site-specific integrase [Listeria booriae]MBC2158690.1 tyrosine-type recombinase/integrase [Listeria booriae]